MSSHELIELCEYMHDDGRLKTAMRDGEPSELQQAVLQIANETAVMRAGSFPDSDGKKWGSRMFLGPSLIKELLQDAEETEAFMDRVKGLMRRSTTTREDDD